MRVGKRLKAVHRAFGDHNETSIAELRAAISLTFSEPELLRRGCWYCGRKTKLTAAYADGTGITDAERCQLIELGINQVINAVKQDCRAWLTIDTKRGVVSRVRK